MTTRAPQPRLPAPNKPETKGPPLRSRSRPTRATAAVDVAREVADEMTVFLFGARMAPPDTAPGWLHQIEEWHARLSGESE